MADIPKVIIGDSLNIPVNLRIDGAVFTLDPSAEVKARFISIDHETTYSDVVDVNLLQAGSDLANSRIVVVMSSTQSAAIQYSKFAKLEVQVVDVAGVGNRTFFGNVRLIKGSIN